MINEEYISLVKEYKMIGFDPETITLTSSDKLIYNLKKAHNKFEDPKLYSIKPTSSKFRRNLLQIDINLVLNPR